WRTTAAASSCGRTTSTGWRRRRTMSASTWATAPTCSAPHSARSSNGSIRSGSGGSAAPPSSTSTVCARCSRGSTAMRSSFSKPARASRSAAATAVTCSLRPRPSAARPARSPGRPTAVGNPTDVPQIHRMPLFATKPIAVLRAEAEATGEHALVRALGPLNLVTLGIGAVIGAGIFVITGQVAALYAGPAVPLSMILVGVACAFAGLCYAEMASAVPVAGSAYTYAYATMGEFAAWIIGWDLVLEYAAGAATVGVGWSAHFVSLLGLFGVQIPASLTAPPTQWCTAAQAAAHVAGCAHPALNLTGAVINLPAVLIVALMSAVLVIGIRESARVNSVIVILKVA